jgi:hypothetical protein
MSQATLKRLDSQVTKIMKFLAPKEEMLKGRMQLCSATNVLCSVYVQSPSAHDILIAVSDTAPDSTSAGTALPLAHDGTPDFFFGMIELVAGSGHVLLSKLMATRSPLLYAL